MPLQLYKLKLLKILQLNICMYEIKQRKLLCGGTLHCNKMFYTLCSQIMSGPEEANLKWSGQILK